MNSLIKVLGLLTIGLSLVGCREESTDQADRRQQEENLRQGTASVGLPNVANFREKRILKEIYELRDQEGLVTYTYLVAEAAGKLEFLGESVGYPIPYATQYTNPQKFGTAYPGGVYHLMPQADPNGLFSPAAAEASWVLLRNPETNQVKPVYVEGKLATFPWKR